MSLTDKKQTDFLKSGLTSLQRTLRSPLQTKQLYVAGNMVSFFKLFSSFPAIVIVCFFLASCEKVIDVDLNNAAKRYVIEAIITDRPGSCKVLLTQTKNFDENNSFIGTGGAQVTIAGNNGVPVRLIETSAGVYEAPAFVGTPGNTYNLRVAVNGETFTATSLMPAPVPFDSLYITERTFFNETNKYATVRYKDPAGVQNAYRFIQYVNGVKEKTIFVRDDDSNDGLSIERALLYFYDDEEAEEKKLKRGDNLTVEMLSISYPVYKYWYSLEQGATGSSQSATPGNPVTNIQGGALGYFSAHTIQTKTVVVP